MLTSYDDQNDHALSSNTEKFNKKEKDPELQVQRINSTLRQSITALNIDYKSFNENLFTSHLNYINVAIQELANSKIDRHLLEKLDPDRHNTFHWLNLLQQMLEKIAAGVIQVDIAVERQERLKTIVIPLLKRDVTKILQNTEQ